jgi:hypothetical protein
MSSRNDAERTCHCGNPVKIAQCQKGENAGRWFSACPLEREFQCKKSFKWMDESKKSGDSFDGRPEKRWQNNGDQNDGFGSRDGGDSQFRQQPQRPPNPYYKANEPAVQGPGQQSQKNEGNCGPSRSCSGCDEIRAILKSLEEKIDANQERTESKISKILGAQTKKTELPVKKRKLPGKKEPVMEEPESVEESEETEGQSE